MKPWKALIAAAGACLALPAGASATTMFQETPDTWSTCQTPVLENPFLFDGDPLDYVLAPSGSFEGSADGWSLEGGAAVVAGDDPFDLRLLGADEQLLSLPPGSSAVSPLMCVDLSFPTFRFATNQLAHGKLTVEAIYPNSDKPKWRKSGKIRGEEGWTLSDHLGLDPARAGSEPGERLVALRFSVSDRSAESGSGGFEVDDIYIDPRARW